MRERVKGVLGIIDFIIPFEVITAVGLVFAAENIVESYLETGQIPLIWLEVYAVIVLLMAAGRILTANEEEIDELEDDYEDLTD